MRIKLNIYCGRYSVFGASLALALQSALLREHVLERLLSAVGVRACPSASSINARNNKVLVAVGFSYASCESCPPVAISLYRACQLIG